MASQCRPIVAVYIGQRWFERGDDVRELIGEAPALNVVRAESDVCFAPVGDIALRVSATLWGR